MKRLKDLVRALKNCGNAAEKLQVLGGKEAVFSLSLSQQVIFKSLQAMGLGALLEELDEKELVGLLDSLEEVESFYAPLGGIVGYHLQTLSLLSSQKKSLADVYEPPVGVNIRSEAGKFSEYFEEGLKSLPLFGEIYVVGGAADRLRPCHPVTFDPLPAASLNFCGYTLLEWLIRDVEAKEHLYYQRFGKRVQIPLALMTSQEKNNHDYILSFCEEKKWFGRGQEGIRLFRQPLVPTMDQMGNWCSQAPGKLLMKPGGHGVLWKLAQERGVFDWMKAQGKAKVLIRQINNPISGVDGGLLAFCGVGISQNKQFGFASCPRQVNAAEGMNVIAKRGGCCALTNVEYCEFEKCSIKDLPAEPGGLYSRYPSNTNILFADINAVQEKLLKDPFPGLIVNAKSVALNDKEKMVVRLESMMQNIADSFSVKSMDELPTFLTDRERHKTISAIKKKVRADGKLLETPDACVYDWLRNMTELLQEYCGMQVPEIVPPVEGKPLPFFFLYHPKLGPLFTQIAAKIQGGKLYPGAEVRLEIADVQMRDVKVSGALLIEGEGSCQLKGVHVENAGIDYTATGEYWKGVTTYQQRCVIKLAKGSKLYAENISLKGNICIELQEGERAMLIEEAGRIKKAPAMAGAF